MKSRITRGITVVATLWVTTGCYTFRPASPTTVEPGTGIRVTISREEALRQADVLGGLETELRGTATGQTTDASLGLTVPAVGSGPNARFNSFVSIPWSSVETVETRSFSLVRSVGASVAAAVVTVGLLAFTNVLGEGGGEDPPTDSFTSFRLFSIGW